jgi:hypothetical protein
MATHRAIASTCEAIIHLLRMNYAPSDFDKELEFKVYTSSDFLTPMDAGVSLFLYRVFVNGTHRTPAGRFDDNGRRQKTQLPIDLHFLLTAWGKEASLQHAIAGWMMRVLEDTPMLPAGLLNSGTPDVFYANETVEICPTELRTEDMLRIWETLTQNTYQLSIPYLARNLRIESTQVVPILGEAVQERVADFRELARGHE